MRKIWMIIIVLLVVGGFGVYLFAQRHPGKPQKTAQPQPAKSQPSHDDSALAKMSLRDKVASLLIANTPGTDPRALGRFMDTYKLGGAILMEDNIPGSDAALLAETAAIRGADAKSPRLVAIDQEGGTVRRLRGDNYPSALTLKHQPVGSTADAFAARSALVQSVGITLNFGIIADVTANSNSFIFDRVLGTTPAAAADRVTAAVNATNGKTLSTIKHFPGHGETKADSHATIPTIPISYDQWKLRDEPPFKAGIEAGADVVMVGHLRYSAVDAQPASLSKKWHDILRHQLEFNGVIITDAMGMLQNSGEVAYADPVQNAVAALQAGNTMLLYVFDDTPHVDLNVLIDGITAAVKSGKIDEKIIDQDVKQALTLRAKTATLIAH